jgi:hypothetical protein
VSGIETYATKLYSKYLTSGEDLGVVLGIVNSR